MSGVVCICLYIRRDLKISEPEQLFVKHEKKGPYFLTFSSHFACWSSFSLTSSWGGGNQQNQPVWLKVNYSDQILIITCLGAIGMGGAK